MRWAMILALSSAAAACGGSATPPQPPVVNPTPGTQTISGAERIGWDQAASDSTSLAAIRYAVYVDGTRSELAGVTCSPATSGAQYSCSARLPSLSAGGHSLQIASFVVDGTTLESTRSATLAVNVVPLIAIAAPEARGTTPRSDGATDTAHSGVNASAEGDDGMLSNIVDLAAARDGRLFAADRRGRVLIVDGAHITIAATLERSLAGGELLALAIDPDFTRTRYLYLLTTSPSKRGGAMFSIVRLREAHGTFADAIVVLDTVRAAAPAAGALRFGPDRKLYAAFDRGGESASDAASFNGKLLRLNPDGTTPDDQPRASPIVTGDLMSPTAIAWSSEGTIWVADRGAGAQPRLHAIAGGRTTSYALPRNTAPTGLATPATGALLVSSATGAGLLRVRLDGSNGRPVGAQWMTEGRDEGVGAMAMTPDGAIYIATAGRIERVKE